MTSPVLDQIQAEAHKWHEAVVLLGHKEELNGNFDSVLRKALRAEEKLDILWDQYRRDTVNKERFKDHHQMFQAPSVFETVATSRPTYTGWHQGHS